MKSSFKRILREPLVHFLAIGLALFVLYGLVNDDQSVKTDRIDITSEDIDQLVAIFGKQWQRLPTGQELQALIDARVREEVLYREGLAMGLDKDDTIVRRRLAQKVEFLIGDVSGVTEPDAVTLQAYYEEHADRYREAPRLDFTHVYFSVDRRGEGAAADAAKLLEQLRAARAPAAVALEAGDPILLARQYRDRSIEDVARDFGRNFAEAIATVETQQWRGPFTSGYGLHLVHVSSRREARLPPLDEVRNRVVNDWLVEQRREANERIYERVRARYDVRIADMQTGSN